MARRTSTLLKEQPSLWDDEAQPTETPAPAPQKPGPKTAPKQLRNHTLGLAWPWNGRPLCIPTCLVCRKPDGMGTCQHGCAVVCGRPTPLDREKSKAPVEVCLITLSLPARLIGGHAAVECPHCDATHGHPPKPGRTYHIAPCRQPYVIHLEA